MAHTQQGPEDRLWSVAEVSYYLGVPANTLYLWRSERRGPASRRVGRHLRYRSEDVCGPRGGRTHNPRIKSPLLCH